jgi:hypothetical protein
MYQDIRRHRAVVFLDAKGSQDNEDMLIRMAAATGRLDELRLFTLNPGAKSASYNPLYLPPRADPRQVAERFFSTLEPGFDNAFYRDKARELVLALVAALASTGKQMVPWDLDACIADQAILAHALAMASDRQAVRQIETAYAAAGDHPENTYAGLLAALRAYNHAALNSYTPDIVLDDLIEAPALIGFSLCANAYQLLARAIGILVLQHIQHVGAKRQMDRSLRQDPIYLYADEFYSFAYPGFIDAVNKLRDAHIAVFLAHQDISDLAQVSPEFAQGVLANTRNKIVLFQDNPDFCELLARSIGTRHGTELTIRRSVDAYLNQTSALEASSREVAEFILHTDAFKSLATGQAYLVQKGLRPAPPPSPWWALRRRAPTPSPTTTVQAVHLSMIEPGFFPAASPPSYPSRDDSTGLGLYRMFLAPRTKRP